MRRPRSATLAFSRVTAPRLRDTAADARLSASDQNNKPRSPGAVFAATVESVDSSLRSFVRSNSFKYLVAGVSRSSQLFRVSSLFHSPDVCDAVGADKESSPLVDRKAKQIEQK